MDFFNKVRDFKQDVSELFYVPEVTTAAIICNIKIGNRYVELIDRAKQASDINTIEEKYGYTYDQIVSATAGKTLILVELL